MSLTWEPATAPAGTTFNVYHSSSSPVPIDSTHRIGSGLTTAYYKDVNVGPLYHYYVVTLVNSGGIESLPSNTVWACPSCPPPPDGQTVEEPMKKERQLSNVVAATGSFQTIQQKESAIMGLAKNYASPAAATTVRQPNENTTIRVNYSLDAEVVAVRALSGTAIPAAPANLQAEIAPSYDVVYLTWDPATAPTGTTFNVYRSDSSVVPIDGTHLIAGGLSVGSFRDDNPLTPTNYYVVTAVNVAGESDPSNMAEACLSCPMPASFTYGDNAQWLLARMEDNTFSTMTTTSLAVATAYLHYDPLGSVIFISGEDGAVVAGGWTHHLPSAATITAPQRPTSPTSATPATATTTIWG